jgi:hypothetical protein
MTAVAAVHTTMMKMSGAMHKACRRAVSRVLVTVCVRGASVAVSF